MSELPEGSTSDGRTGIVTRVLLLRHAETAAPEFFHGAESDVALGARGHAQAREAAARLAECRPAAIYSSDMRRARETAATIAAVCGVDHHVVTALHERRMGPLSGVPRASAWTIYADAKARWASGELEFTHPGGESYAEIRDRAVPAFLELVERHRGETIVLVAHGVVIRVLIATLLDDLGPRDFDRIAIDFVGVNDLRWDGTRWSAVLCGQTDDSY